MAHPQEYFDKQKKDRVLLNTILLAYNIITVVFAIHKCNIRSFMYICGHITEDLSFIHIITIMY